MDETRTNPALESWDIRFVDNYIPLLEADHYTIKIEQSLSGSGAHPVQAAFSETQEFIVSGPRFRLDPADIQSKYPPPNSQGIFEHDLPHIVLTKRSLPWERSVFDQLDGSPDRAAPWLALLVLDAREILPPPKRSDSDSQTENPTGVTTIQVKDLLNVEGGGLTDLYPPNSLDDREKEEACQVFTITWETFQAVMPKRDDLKYLAHCREVNLAPKAIPGPARPGEVLPPGNGTAWYSVVVAGRFPSPPPQGAGTGELNVVHLVSLEGYARYIDGTEIVSPETRIRLVSLASWTFTCLPERGESFSELMRALVRGDRESLNFRLPLQAAGSDEAVKYAAEMLAAGYVPRSYHTRQGEKTFGWYRGPFTPQLVPRLPTDRQPFTSAAQAMIYDPERGLFDLSYAVAWEIGRMLALSDQTFGVHLLNRRRKAHRQVDLLRERSSFRLPQAPMATAGGSQPFQALLERNLVSRSFMQHLVGDFAREIKGLISKPDDQFPSDGGPELAESVNSYALLADYHQKPAIQQFIKGSDAQELDPITKWLAQLYLLYGVPFINLVAHERLLPPETIRFFYLDRNWLEVLLDGALSIGVHSSRDSAYQKLMGDAIATEARKQVQTMRNALLGYEGDANSEISQSPMAGLLVRSAVISGWPGLEVRAYRHGKDDQDPSPIGLLRMDHLSADVLLCIFATVPDRIEFNEPKEGLHFGVEADNGTTEIGLRYVSGEDRVGKLCEPGKKLDTQRDRNRRLDIEKLVKTIKGELDLFENDAFGPAAFALQMVKVPQQMVFKTSDQS